METFDKVRELYKKHMEFRKQRILLYSDPIIKSKDPKYELIDELVRLISEGYSLVKISKELGIARQTIYLLGIRKRLKKEGYKILDGIIILHNAMKQLKSVERPNDKIIIEERRRMKDILYDKIAYINRYYYISLHTISEKLGFRPDYLNKSLARRGTQLHSRLKFYGDKIKTEIQEPDRLEEDNRLETPPPFTA